MKNWVFLGFCQSKQNSFNWIKVFKFYIIKNVSLFYIQAEETDKSLKENLKPFSWIRRFQHDKSIAIL